MNEKVQVISLSIPEALVKFADAAARDLGVSRSKYVAQLLRMAEAEKRAADDVTVAKLASDPEFEQVLFKMVKMCAEASGHWAALPSEVREGVERIIAVGSVRLLGADVPVEPVKVETARHKPYKRGTLPERRDARG